MKIKPLSDQLIVIIGASSGIGLVTAHLVSKAGARVVVAARNENALRQLVEEMGPVEVRQLMQRL